MRSILPGLAHGLVSTCLHPIADQFFPLAVWSLGVFLFDDRNSRHAAVVLFSTQPAREGAHQQLSVEAIDLRGARARPERSRDGMT